MNEKFKTKKNNTKLKEMNNVHHLQLKRKKCYGTTEQCNQLRRPHARKT